MLSAACCRLLSQVPVVVGFGEVGPWGSARTRWEWEVFAHFSIEGAIELARSMGLIAFHSGPTANPAGALRCSHLSSHLVTLFWSQTDGDYVGWVDAKSKQPVADHEVGAQYAATILEHCGVRQIEPALFEGLFPVR